MEFVLVENGKVLKEGLPEIGVLKDGSAVSGYHLLDEEILLDEGWLPLEDNPPEYNPETQYLIDDGYEIFEDKVVKKYRIEDIPEPELQRPNVTELIAEYLIDVDFRLSLMEIGLI